MKDYVLQYGGEFIQTLIAAAIGWFFGRKKLKAEVTGMNAENESKEIDNDIKLSGYYKELLDDLKSRYEIRFQELENRYEIRFQEFEAMSNRKVQVLESEITMRDRKIKLLEREIAELKRENKQLRNAKNATT
ncbi:MAG: hypothetical protein E2604_11815 [Flavobacterium sp.]|uniref:hypothetical protein n=1 Tax=Flavobacterium sp. UBA4197 TaxID=1946546 RepID=UPI0012D26540|nr:hypothetical protein [Flavobacterium sp. UBA4197]MPT35739.1 hypothetical protein [Flavobacterium sp.]